MCLKVSVFSFTKQIKPANKVLNLKCLFFFKKKIIFELINHLYFIHSTLLLFF